MHSLSYLPKMSLWKVLEIIPNVDSWNILEIVLGISLKRSSKHEYALLCLRFDSNLHDMVHENEK